MAALQMTLYTRPYSIGSTVFTFAWANGSNINTFITSTYATYPKAFASAPFYTQGSGAPDSVISFTLASGYIVSQYVQAQYGTQNMGTLTSGGTYSMYVGVTVSGLSGTNITLPGSGNGGSNMTISYKGA